MPNDSVNVIVSNKLSQVVYTTVLDEQGAPSELKLLANANSEPVKRASLSDHLLSLVSKGHLKLRPA